MKIDINNKELIKVCRESILKLSKSQNVIYDQMTSIIGQDNDDLWEYCFSLKEDPTFLKNLLDRLF